MSDAITPALSAEEWIAGEVSTARASAEDCGDSLIVRVDGDYSSALFGPAGRHALAALALHGQPFGFTHDDVETLLSVADADYDGMDAAYWVGDEGLYRKLRTLIARIEALLPPE